MSIPDYQSLMLPLLKLLADGAEHRFSDVVEALADKFDLSPAERDQRLPSGPSRLITNRTGWARTYLGKAGLVEAKRRGFLRITERGQEALAGNPSRIDVKFLSQFPEFSKFREGRQSGPGGRAKLDGTSRESTEETPEEALESSYQRLQLELEAEVIEQVLSCSPPFFERLVVELLVTMGYGGSLKDAGQAVGRSGDGGIDGIIKQDHLGLDLLYLQAKRWGAVVGRPEIQKFAGALQGHRARKGVFITTSSFSREAREYAGSIDSKIVLIDGTQLASLMVDHGVGVATLRTYQVRRLDSDYFAEE